MATLYEIDSAIAALVDPETGEITDIEALEALDMERETKLENIALYIKNLESDAEQYKAEKAAFADKQRAAEDKAAKLREVLQTALAGAPLKRTKVSVTFRSAQKVEIEDVRLLAPEYIRQREPEADKAAIKNALKAGFEVIGAKLVESQSMTIK